ncbi:MAG: hypothetical protein H6745_33130 [Deltaproteobacteria bacterium]|nr:hypothetical protein [Deltaproteobacteria bacterium]
MRTPLSIAALLSLLPALTALGGSPAAAASETVTVRAVLLCPATPAERGAGACSPDLDDAALTAALRDVLEGIARLPGQPGDLRFTLAGAEVARDDHLAAISGAPCAQDDLVSGVCDPMSVNRVDTNETLLAAVHDRYTSTGSVPLVLSAGVAGGCWVGGWKGDGDELAYQDGVFCAPSALLARGLGDAARDRALLDLLRRAHRRDQRVSHVRRPPSLVRASATTARAEAEPPQTAREDGLALLPRRRAAP